MTDETFEMMFAGLDVCRKVFLYALLVVLLLTLSVSFSSVSIAYLLQWWYA